MFYKMTLLPLSRSLGRNNYAIVDDNIEYGDIVENEKTLENSFLMN